MLNQKNKNFFKYFYKMKKLFLLSILIILISQIKTFAGFPEGEKGFDLKKNESKYFFIN